MSTVGQSGSTTGESRAATTLVADIARLVWQLIRDEFALAGAEIGRSARTLMGAIAMLVCAAGLVLAGLLALLSAVVAGLATIMPVWQAALISGIGALLVGGLLAYLGQLTLRRIDIIPPRTRRTLVETTAWVKEIVD